MVTGKVLHVIVRLYMVVMFPVAVGVCLGPFVAPFVAMPLAVRVCSVMSFVSGLAQQLIQQAYVHRCDSYPVQVVFDSPTYNSPNNTPSLASFYYYQNNIRTKYFQYNLIRGNTNESFYFDFLGVVPGVLIPAENYPLVWRTHYQLTNNTLSGSCASNSSTPSNETIPCLIGTFDPGKYLSYLSLTLVQTTRLLSMQWTKTGLCVTTLPVSSSNAMMGRSPLGQQDHTKRIVLDSNCVLQMEWLGWI
jgi:hypothetical protein